MKDELRQLSAFDRIEDFPNPPEDLDLLTATQGQLIFYGIPPRPDPDREHELYSVWSSFFSPRPTFLQEKVKTQSREFRVQTRESAPAAIDVSGATRYESSRNWCGTYIEPNDYKVFVQVSGFWTVPKPAPPPNAEPGDYTCSAWVGLDGQRRYFDSSLPQIGTWQKVTLLDDGTTEFETFAWFQWWAKDYPNNRPYPIQHFPLSIGDRVGCIVRAWDRSAAYVAILNFNTGLFFRKKIQAPVVRFHTPKISGATAEWIMERPAILHHPHQLYPLADYGRMEFSGCYAAEANPALPNWPQVVGTSQKLDGERLIRMYDVLPNPNRTRFISMAQKTSKTSAVVSYGGFRD